jgi:hypothetical protein
MMPLLSECSQMQNFLVCISKPITSRCLVLKLQTNSRKLASPYVRYPLTSPPAKFVWEMARHGRKPHRIKSLCHMLRPWIGSTGRHWKIYRAQYLVEHFSSYRKDNPCRHGGSKSVLSLAWQADKKKPNCRKRSVAFGTPVGTAEAQIELSY